MCLKINCDKCGKSIAGFENDGRKYSRDTHAVICKEGQITHICMDCYKAMASELPAPRVHIPDIPILERGYETIDNNNKPWYRRYDKGHKKEKRK